MRNLRAILVGGVVILTVTAWHALSEKRTPPTAQPEPKVADVKQGRRPDVRAQACVMQPTGIAMGPEGGVYLADVMDDIVVRVDPDTGQMELVAGLDPARRQRGGTGKEPREGVAATAVPLQGAVDVAFDSAGNLHVLEIWLGSIARIDSKTGILTRVTLREKLNRPRAFAIDSRGNFYVAEWAIRRTVRIDPRTGIATQIHSSRSALPEGLGHPHEDPFGPRSVYGPQDVAATDAGDVFIADIGDRVIYRFNAGQNDLSVVLGRSGPPPEPGTERPLPAGPIAVDASGNLLVLGSRRILEVSQDGKSIHVLADGLPESSHLVAAGSDRDMYVVAGGFGSYELLRVDHTHGGVRTVRLSCNEDTAVISPSAGEEIYSGVPGTNLTYLGKFLRGSVFGGILHP